MSRREQLGRRFARLATEAVVRRPALWPLFRRPLAWQFDALAPRWDALRDPEHLAPLEAALRSLPRHPRRVLDVGTGTGAAAVAAARRFPRASVVGVDLAPAMVEEARRRLPPELRARVEFEVADAAALPFVDASFDLVTLANAIPFFAELRRLVSPGGAVILAFSSGPSTPIFVPFARLRTELGAQGFGAFREAADGRGSALIAVRDGDS